MSGKFGAGATIGYGALVDDELPTSFATIGNVFSIDGPSISVETLDCTNLASTGKEFVASPIPDGGEVTVSYYVDKTITAQNTLRDGVYDGTVWGFRITFTDDASKAEFKAIVSAINYSGIEANGLIQVEMTLKVSGLIEFSAV